MVRSATSKNQLINNLSASVSSIMESKVSGNLTTVCENIQSVRNVSNCNVTFSEQTCAAVGISDLTSNVALEAELAQDVMSSLSQSAKSQTEGLAGAMGDTSTASNGLKNMVEVAMTATQTFNTTCTRNVTAVNRQTLENCESSTVNFADQDVSAEVIGNCVANQVGSTKAAQSLTNVVDMQASATSKGIDLWMLFLIGAGVLLAFVFGAPIFAYVRNQLRNPKTAAELAQETQMTNNFYAIVVIFVVILLGMLLWWPGLGSMALGIMPWSYVGPVAVGGQPSQCVAGERLDAETVINKWVWYDPHCAYLKAQTGHGTGDGTGNSFCTPEKRLRHYRHCGLFADNGCNDPVFLREKANYVRALEACGGLSGVPFDTCSPESIAFAVFATEEHAYGNCHMCTGNSEEEREALGEDRFRNRGLWAAEGKSCVNIDHLAHIGYGGCDTNTTNCFFESEKDEFLEVSADECTNAAYQAAKRRFARYLAACQGAKEVAGPFASGELKEHPLVAQMCPPNAFNYFSKCRAGDKTCRYAPEGCTCDEAGSCECRTGVDPFLVASCQNNLDSCCRDTEDGRFECLDDEYKMDLKTDIALNQACQKRHADREKLHPWGWAVPLAIYILGIGAILYILKANPALATHFSAGMMGAAGASGTGSAGQWRSIRDVVVLIILALLVLAGVVLLMLCNEWWPFPKGYIDDLDSFDPEVYTYVAYAWIGVFSLALLGYLGYVMFIRKPETPTKAKKDK
jgi:hypothetical protein